MKRLLIISIAVTFFVGVLGLSYAKAEKPFITKEHTEEYWEFGPTDSWTDDFGYYHDCGCGVPFSIDVDLNAIYHDFDDHSVWNAQYQATYTNLDTDYSFVEIANVNYKIDWVTGLATHNGLFFHIVDPSTGMVVLDAGKFVQDWYSPNWTILPESLKGANHDVNGPYADGEQLPPISYCDLLNQNFTARKKINKYYKPN